MNAVHYLKPRTPHRVIQQQPLGFPAKFMVVLSLVFLRGKSYGVPPMGVKERKERERQQRAHDIVEAAHRIFETRGFLNTTLQDVAKEAEISVGLIYRYFQSKEDIFASLALKGAEDFDKKIDALLKKAARKRTPPRELLASIAATFFDFFGPYGEYFDMLIYSYKGLKEVQIHGTTITRLMSVTLATLDKIKCYILESPQFRAKDEDEALSVTFLLWGILLGCHKLLDSSGRGHLFAFRNEDFVSQMIDHVLSGISTSATEGRSRASRLPSIKRIPKINSRQSPISPDL